jgi:hypothetical protein
MANNGWLSMPPNSQPANLTHDATAASQTFGETKKNKNRSSIKQKEVKQKITSNKK